MCLTAFFFFLAIYDVSCYDLSFVYSAWVLLNFLNLLANLEELPSLSLQILTYFFSFRCSDYKYNRFLDIILWVTEPYSRDLLFLSLSLCFILDRFYCSQVHWIFFLSQGNVYYAKAKQNATKTKQYFAVSLES